MGGDDIRPTPEKTYRRGYKRQQVAEMFGCHIATIDRLIASGKLKAHRLSARNITILDADIEEFIAAHQIKPAAA
jgi:excisionase family DNA binding protein